VRERRYTGPEEAVQPGLLFEEPTEATDADGVTAEEAVAEVVEQQASGNEAAAEGETVAAEGEAPAAVETSADVGDPAAEAADSSSDAGEAQAGAQAGDKPA
jgi:hypothetical protein